MRAFSLALAQAESPQEVGAQRRRDFSRRMARLAFRQRISISALNSDRVTTRRIFTRNSRFRIRVVGGFSFGSASSWAFLCGRSMTYYRNSTKRLLRCCIAPRRSFFSFHRWVIQPPMELPLDQSSSPETPWDAPHISRSFED